MFSIGDELIYNNGYFGYIDNICGERIYVSLSDGYYFTLSNTELINGIVLGNITHKKKSITIEPDFKLDKFKF